MTPRLLLIGGLDPSGGAGITADVLVAHAHGAFPLPIAVALTVQNGRGFERCDEVRVPQWRDALTAVLDDGPVAAVKLGLLGGEATIAAVAAVLQPLRGRVPIVVDPVLSATAGGWTAAPAVAAAYREHLLPLASLLLPNAPEAEALGCTEPAAAFVAGCGALLAKGGHTKGEFAEDVLHTPVGDPVVFRRPRLPVGPVRGTGCALATAIAALLASGVELSEAVRRGGDWLHTLLASLEPAAAGGLPRPLPFGRAFA